MVIMVKVALLTTLDCLPPMYGLVPVIVNQLKMLSKYHDDEVGLFIMEGSEAKKDWRGMPPNIKLEPFVPFMHLYDYAAEGSPKQEFDVPAEGIHHDGINRNETNFDKQVRLIVDSLENRLMYYDVVITHDIMFQGWFLPHNAACRIVGGHYPKIKWIHWCHSGPSIWGPSLTKGVNKYRFSGMQNSIFVSPNEAMAPGFAKMYNVPRNLIKVVYHIFEPTSFFKFNPISTALVEKHNLLNADVLAVWATRIDHLQGKGIPFAVNFMANLNRLCNAKLMFLNSWSSTDAGRNSIKAIRKIADEKGLPPENLGFSSELDEKWENGVPPEVVHDLLQISNLFIFPSSSETFSYSLAEAAVSKNLLLLNQNLEVMTELAGDTAEYVKTMSDYAGKKITEDYKDGEDGYCAARADEVWTQIKTNKVLMAQRRWLRDFRAQSIWEEQMKPLIEGKW